LDIDTEDEMGILGAAFNTAVQSINQFVTELNILVDSTAEGKLDFRADTTKLIGNYRLTAEGINNTFNSFIEPQKVATEYFDRIKKGDIPPKITDDSNGVCKEMNVSLNGCIDTMERLFAEIDKLVTATEQGNFGARGKARKFEGSWGTLISGINNVIDVFVGPINITAEYIERISKGDIPPKITEGYDGDFNEIINSLNNCIDAVNALVADANLLSSAAVEGNLSARADTSKHQGDFRKIVEGVNDTLDAVIEPLKEAEEVLGKMAFNDFESQMIGKYQGSLKVLSDSINNVRARLLSVEDAFINISQGDLSRMAEFQETGKHSENDRLVPSIIAMMQVIGDLTLEANMLANAAVSGNLTIRGNVDKFEGSYKEIIQGMNNTMEAIAQPLKEIFEVLSSMEHNDFTISMDGDYKGEYLKIKEATNNTISAISKVLTDMNQAAEQVAAGSRQVSDASQSLSQGASEQASAIEQLSASITEVAAQTRHNAANATQANDLANSAKNDAAIGTVQMKEMVKSMEEINESSIKVSKVIKVIDDIAFQTNMLALNAAVEAARAGEHGKGFAVVADEVRNLAARSASAVKETSEMIESSLERTGIGTKIANETATALDKIVTGVEKAATLVSEIASSSNEQATGISQINRGIEQVSHVVQTNSATAEQSAASSEELSGQAESLKQMVNKFKLSNNTAINELISKKIIPSPKTTNAQAAVAKAPRKITLSENDFGKY